MFILLSMVFLVLTIVFYCKYDGANFENMKLKREINRLNNIIVSMQNGEPLNNNSQASFQQQSQPSIQQRVVTTQQPPQPQVQAQSQVHFQVQTQPYVRPQPAPRPVTPKEPKDKKKIINGIILTSGAIFIILAAIVFLGSTWNVLSSVIKCTTMLFFVFVFLGASLLAEKVFKLTYTGKTFFYIAMSYIPILFGSLWGFGLIQDIIKNISGYAYLMITSTITAFIYFAFYKLRNSKVLICSSSIFGLFALHGLAGCFEIDQYVPLCAYGLILTLLVYFFKTNKFNLTIVFVYNAIAFLFITQMASVPLTVDFMKFNIIDLVEAESINNVMLGCSLLLTCISLIMLYFKEVYKYANYILSLITTYLFITYAVTLFTSFSYEIKSIIILGLFILLNCIIDLILNKKENVGLLKNTNFVFACVLEPLVVAYLLLYLSGTYYYKLTMAIIMLINCIRFFVRFYTSKKTIGSLYKYIGYGFAFLFVITIGLTLELQASIMLFIPLLFAFAIYVIENVVKKLKDEFGIICYLILFVIGLFTVLFANSIYIHIVSIGLTVLMMVLFIINKENRFCRLVPLIGCSLLLTNFHSFPDLFTKCIYLVPTLAIVNCILYFVKYSKSSINALFKYLGYFFVLIIMIKICAGLKASTEFILTIPLIWSLFIYFIEGLVKEFQDKASVPIYSIIFTLSYIIVLFINNEFAYGFGIISSFIIYWISYLRKEPKYFRYFPLSACVLLLLNLFKFDNSIYYFFNLVFRLIVPFTLTMLTIYKKKVIPETWFAFIGMIIFTETFNNTYFTLIILLLWEVLCLFEMNSKNDKNILLSLAYLTGFILVVKIINDTILNQYSAPYKIAIVVFTMLFLKTVLKNYIKKLSDRDLVDYLVFTLIYLISIFSYTSEYDGMVFCGFILLLLFYCYFRKHGAIFITSIVALTINVLLLTRRFWTSLPWWVYLLLNGFVHGLIKANIGTVLQESTPNNVQTSVMSIASTFCRLIYIPVVYFVNYLGNIKLTYALAGTLIVFVPFFIINMIFLKKIKD